MSTKLPPHQPGWVLFKRLRHSTRPGTIEYVNEPVKVINYPYPTFAKRELAVVMAGRSDAYPLKSFEGEWFAISLEVA